MIACRRDAIPAWLRQKSPGRRAVRSGALAAAIAALGLVPAGAAGQEAARAAPAGDPELQEELAESFQKLEEASSHRMTLTVPMPPGDEMEMTLEPMVMEWSGGHIRSVMRAQTEEGPFVMESVVAPDRYAARMELPGMEEMQAQLAAAKAGGATPGGLPGLPGGGLPGLPGGIPGLSSVLSGGIPGLSSVVSGAIPGLSGIMDSPIVSGAVGLLTGGFSPMNLLSVGMSMAGGMMMSPNAMAGGLLGGDFGDWHCEKLDLSDEESGEEAAAGEGETAGDADWLRSAVRLGDVEIDGVSATAYRLEVEQDGEAAELTIYTLGPGGLPRRMEIASREMEGKMTIDYAYEDIPEIEFPDCK